jgi:hypothetical protein
MNNVLFRKNIAGDWTATAFDFSRAGPIKGFPPGPSLPLAATSNTTLTSEWLRTMKLWRSSEAQLTIASLQGLQTSTIEAILSDMPDTWFNDQQRQALIAWWGSADRNARLFQTSSLL